MKTKSVLNQTVAQEVEAIEDPAHVRDPSPGPQQHTVHAGQGAVIQDHDQDQCQDPEMEEEMTEVMI